MGLLKRRIHVDDRGSFETLFDEASLGAVGFGPTTAQVALATNVRARTLRGMHFQASSHPQQKLVTCLQGRIFDVVVDVRPTSKTYGAWTSYELAAGGPTLAVPDGCAHGYLTLEPRSVVMYHLSSRGEPTAERGVRWDEADFDIRWPFPPEVISARDRKWPKWSLPDTARVRDVSGR